jgi:hypothetical protein
MAAGFTLFVLAALPARAYEGRILGSLQHVDDVYDTDYFRMLYELGGHQTITNNVDMRLRMSLDYFSQLQGRNSDLWRSRFFGEVRAPIWRVEAQYAPWQLRDPLGRMGSERDARLGLRVTPRRLPNLDLHYERRDRDQQGARSYSEDRWARLSYAREASSVSFGYRRLDWHPAPGLVAAVRTTQEEWRGSLLGSKAWRRATLGGEYEGQLTRLSALDRRSEQGIQRALANGTYIPHPKVRFGGHVLRRWGYIADNAASGGHIDETSYGASAGYRPSRDLELQLMREYRREQSVGSDALSDYLQGDVRFRRPMARDLWFQAGYLGVVDLASRVSSVPSTTVYALVDGRLQRGMEGRAEVRAAHHQGFGLSGLQWNRFLQLRTRPAAPVRFDVEWRLDTQAEYFGVGQEDREWHLLGGYDPTSATSATVSWRRQDGEGRIPRSEEAWAVTGTQRLGDQSSLSINWSRRDILVPNVGRVSDVLSFDLTTWLPSRWQARASYRTDLSGPVDRRSYGVVLEKRF